MEDKLVTPEKQLLHLIEDGRKEGHNREVRNMAVRHFGLSFFSGKAWLGRLSFLKNKAHELDLADKTRIFDLKIINNFLLFCIFALLVYSLWHFSFSITNMKKRIPRLEIKVAHAVASAESQDALGLKKALSYYLDKTAKRDLFKIGKKDLPAAGYSDKAVEATKHLKLVGISWSENPDAMIEDSKAQRTFFVKRSQMIGDVKVEAIFKDKVILNYAGEDIELK